MTLPALLSLPVAANVTIENNGILGLTTLD
jgi:hypothetical protein